MHVLYQAYCLCVYIISYWLSKSTRWLSHICCRWEIWIQGCKGTFLRSNINSRIWDSNPVVPDAILLCFFPVALREVNQRDQGSQGFPVLLRLTVVTTLLFPLKKDEGDLKSYFYGLEPADNFENGVYFPLWYLHHFNFSSL